MGAGGFGREVFCGFKNDFLATGVAVNEIVFMDENIELRGSQILGVPVIMFEDFDPAVYQVVIAVGEPETRKRIVERLPANTVYSSLTHSNATVMDLTSVGEGSVITSGSILTTNITVGKHAHINLNTTIGHDCVIGDFFTTAPGVNISGYCKIGNGVYFGTNASVKNGITVCDNVTVGMGAVVTKDILEEGIYVGNPLRKLERK